MHAEMAINPVQGTGHENGISLEAGIGKPTLSRDARVESREHLERVCDDRLFRQTNKVMCHAV